MENEKMPKSLLFVRPLDGPSRQFFCYSSQPSTISVGFKWKIEKWSGGKFFFLILVTLVKMRFFGSPGSKNSWMKKISMWKILFIFGLFEDPKRKKNIIITQSGKPFFVTPPNYPILTKKGCPCLLGGSGGVNLDNHGISVRR